MSRKIVDTEAPAGFEVPEVSEAKDEVQWVVTDLLEYFVDDIDDAQGSPFEPISVADKIVEKLLEMGWRPTTETLPIEVSWPKEQGACKCWGHSRAQ